MSNGYKIQKIYKGNVQVWPDGWTPGANTIAYYKFDGNLNDSSGNSHNMSLYTGSVTYGTTSGGQKYAHFNQNTWTNYRTYSGFNYDGQNTISLWFNPQSSFSSGNNAIIEMRESSSYCFFRYVMTVSNEFGFSSPMLYSASTNSRYNLIYTRNGTSSKWYVNGVLIGSGAGRYTGRTNQTIRFRVNQIADTNSSSYANNGYYSELIWEGKEWTAQEISDYYNLTKGDYGL